MILTAKQEEGLRIAVQRYKDHEPWTCIAGYAGTGKSTLVKFIVDALDVAENKVAYACFTGKGKPHWFISTIKAIVFNATVLPPALGPDISKIRCFFVSLIVNGSILRP